MRATTFLTTAAVLAFAASAAQAGPTLDAVKKKGFLQCGVSTGVPGFSNPNDKNEWSGIDVEYCRAVATAIFGDPKAVKFTPLTAKDRFTALQSGEIDILSRNTTITFSRDVNLGLEFVGVTYYDGQGFIVRKASGVKSALELKGATVCVQSGTTTELNMADFFRSNSLDYKTVVFDKPDEALAAYDSGRCDSYTTDASGLAAQRTQLGKPADHIILPEIISKEPLGPATRQGDAQWTDIARWTLNALILAEEYGVTSKNVDQMKTSANGEIKRLLGVEQEFGKALEIDNAWAFNVIKNVGNYGEVFERTVGPNTPLALARGLNQQWNKGGLLYAPPIR